MEFANFLILLGVSGSGKSSLIRELLQIDKRFVYVSPYTNRSLRKNETDKIYKTDAEIEELRVKGNILIVNEIYGFKYATPKEVIDDALVNEKFPVLDFPIYKLDILKEKYPNDIYSIYVRPPDLEALHERLNDGRDAEGKRFESAMKELKEVEEGLIGGYDEMVVSFKDIISEVALLIYKRFLLNRRFKENLLKNNKK